MFHLHPQSPNTGGIFCTRFCYSLPWSPLCTAAGQHRVITDGIARHQIRTTSPWPTCPVVAPVLELPKLNNSIPLPCRQSQSCRTGQPRTEHRFLQRGSQFSPTGWTQGGVSGRRQRGLLGGSQSPCEAMVGGQLYTGNWEHWRVESKILSNSKTF